MQVETIPVGFLEVNSYVVRGNGQEALVVDPGDDAERILAFLRKHQLSVAAYLITHGHADHVSALAEVHRAYPAPVAMHPDDARWAFGEMNQLPPFYSAPSRPAGLERDALDGREWTDAGLRWKVIATPGHSPGGVCYYFEDEGVLFSGDTLFQGSVGRTDLRGGNPRTLSESIARLARLPDTTRVYPGHGPSTTLAIEKETNYFLRNSVG